MTMIMMLMMPLIVLPLMLLIVITIIALMPRSFPQGRALDRADDLASLFGALLHMGDETVMCVLAFVMAETLAAHSGTVESLGALFGTGMRNWWSPDQAFLDLLRDKQVIRRDGARGGGRQSR